MRDIYVLTGATGGMGSVYARSFKEDGILVLTDVNLDALNRLKSVLDDLNIESEVIVSDISSKESVNELVEFTKSLGKFKALIHTAGLPESFPNTDKIYAVNLIGVKYLTDAFYEISDHSVIVLIASMTGHLVPDNEMYNYILLNPLAEDFTKKMEPFTQGSGNNAYSFAKKGVIMLVEKEVGRFAKKHTRIVAVSPGAVRTAMTSTDASDTAVIDAYVDNTPIPRMALAHEIVNVIKFLSSKDASFITGTDILIDGGMTAFMKYNPEALSSNK